MIKLMTYMNAVGEHFEDATNGYWNVSCYAGSTEPRKVVVHLRCELDDEIARISARHPQILTVIDPAAVAREIVLLFDRRARTFATTWTDLPPRTLAEMQELAFAAAERPFRRTGVLRGV